MGRVGQWLRRLFNVAPVEEMEGIRLEGLCWEVEGRNVDPVEFFRALADLVPDAAILYVEGGSHPEPVRRLLEENTVPEKAKVARGTVWPASSVFHLPATSALLHELARLAETCASPELCDHLHVYDGEGILLQWHDAFGDPFYVSKRLPSDQLEAFCVRLQTPWKEEDCSSIRAAVQ